jgi:hypothetical protein
MVNCINLSGSCNLFINYTRNWIDNVNILGGSIHSIRKNTEALLIASKEIGLEVNAEKTKYSGTSNNGHWRGIQILSVIGGVR